MPILIIFLSMLLSSPQAAPVNSVNLSLEEAVAVAFEHQPGLMLLEQEIQIARAATLIDSAYQRLRLGCLWKVLASVEKPGKMIPNTASD